MESPETSKSSSQSPSAPEFPLSLTSKAVKMIIITRDEEKMDEGYGLRVAVRGGGCSGFEYALDFEQEPRENDHIQVYDNLRVFVDPVSARYLSGTQIDYVLGSTGAGFKFNNPKATGTCGCGSSFAV